MYGMKFHLKTYFLGFIVLIPFLNFGQEESSNLKYDSYGKIIVKNDTIHYYITKIDTIVNHFNNQIGNEQDFSTWDTTYIWADIIFLDLPNKYEKYNIDLGIKLQELITKEKINLLNAFRDEESSTLFRMSSMYPHNVIERRKSYLGTFRQNKTFLISN